VYKVYLISSTIEGITCYKIGYTKRNPKQRIKEMKTGNASDLQVISIFESKWATQIEAKLHKVFSHKKISGEWFELSDTDVKNFQHMCQQSHDSIDLMAKSNLWFQTTKLYKKFA